VILVVWFVETVWVGSKATRERVEVVVLVVPVLVLVLVPGGHGGYYDHVPHFHHCCHHHHHQPRQRPIWDYPCGACVLLKTKGDCPCVACALLWKAFGKLDCPPRSEQKGMGETPNKR